MNVLLFLAALTVSGCVLWTGVLTGTLWLALGGLGGALLAGILFARYVDSQGNHD